MEVKEIIDNRYTAGNPFGGLATKKVKNRLMFELAAPSSIPLYTVYITVHFSVSHASIKHSGT